MSSPNFAIQCSGLGKKYVIRTRRKARSASEEFWALKDVSFEIAPGDVVGVVGRNGAGKSTLLKVLSRIVHPTSGQVTLNGRIAGLLEVGTGFHPELTGRDNVFLNGTLLGMTRREVRSRFDEIVEFAGVQYFLDTPVKRYSSGMYVRLAFAVAAHLQNEIMVLDEVLAVGDAAFQQKCLGKVHQLSSQEGRTVLLVSHNAAVIRDHANRGLRLENGRLTVDGSILQALEGDDKSGGQLRVDVTDWDRADPNWGQHVRIAAIELESATVRMGAKLRYRIELLVFRDVAIGAGQAIITLDDAPVATSFSTFHHLRTGTAALQVEVPIEPLAPGNYSMNVVVGRSSFSDPDLHLDGVMHAATFEVVARTGGPLIDWHPEWWGSIALDATRVSILGNDA